MSSLSCDIYPALIGVAWTSADKVWTIEEGITEAEPEVRNEKWSSL